MSKLKMIEAHHIVKQVLDAFKDKNLPDRLHGITGKVAEWWRSHGREPKTVNPMSSGNVSPVTHYMQFCRQYEASAKGAGEMLNRRVYAELEMEFNENCLETTQTLLHSGVLKESYDVLKCLNEQEFAEMSAAQLAAIGQEGAQLRDVASDFVAHVRALRRKREALIK